MSLSNEFKPDVWRIRNSANHELSFLTVNSGLVQVPPGCMATIEITPEGYKILSVQTRETIREYLP